MKTNASFQDLQDRINQIVGDFNQPLIDYNSVSPQENEKDTTAYEKNDKTIYNYITDWEL